MSTKKDIIHFFDNFAEERSKTMQSSGDTHTRHRLADIIIKEADITKNDTILDIGCGSGEYQKILEKKGFARLYGTDFSKNMIHNAKRCTKNASYTISDLEHGCYRDEEFDIIIMLAVLQFVSNNEKTFNELHRILKPGGRLVIRVLNFKGQKIKDIISRKDKYDFKSQPNTNLKIDYNSIKSELSKHDLIAEKAIRSGFVFSTCPQILLPLNILFQYLIEKTPLTNYGRDLLIIAKKK